MINNQSVYKNFCKALQIKPLQTEFNLTSYSDISTLANKSVDERLTAALQVFIDCITDHEHQTEKVDRVLIDYFISKIDQILTLQVDEIIHHPDFQALESVWKSLEYLVKQTDFQSNIKIELLNVSKEALQSDFNNTTDIMQSGLYKQIYEKEYDTPGGEPIAAIISNYEFDATSQNITLLSNIAKVSAAAHCPFIGSISGKFFNKNNLEEVMHIDELSHYTDRAEYIHWNTFRETEESRYIGLTCPKFLLRLPYGPTNPIRKFNYTEQVFDTVEKYLFGHASFAFAVNMVKSFHEYGWTVNIRGPESGGKVEKLLLHQYDLGHGLLTKIPTEVLIPETRELELSNLGFIPLSYYKNSDYACFFSANSVQKPTLYLSKEATANSRINTRLPYIFLSARIAHYLKVLQRETIGSNITRKELEERLNIWLHTLITKMNNPDPEQIASHPLRDGHVEVTEIVDNPGFYRVVLYAMPHFQIEGVDVNLSIVGKMPKNQTT
jgi:type VI secretion system protein ImpC